MKPPLPPVGPASKVIGVGMNYRSFLAGVGEEQPPQPVLFHKTAAALCASGQPILVPPETREVVPEGELAVVIGTRASRVSRKAAIEHVAGIACANDVSARNLEFRTSQWTAGKMLDTFCPLGPELVPVDARTAVAVREIKTYVDDEMVQAGRTDDMVFDVLELVSRISHLVTLQAGDVILTGTPSDLGVAEPPVFLEDGQTVRVEIEGLGALKNPVKYLPVGS